MVAEIRLGLNIMTVAPKHQHKGAGTLLLKWGTAIADKIGAAVRSLSPIGDFG